MKQWLCIMHTVVTVIISSSLAFGLAPSQANRLGSDVCKDICWKAPLNELVTDSKRCAMQAKHPQMFWFISFVVCDAIFIELSFRQILLTNLWLFNSYCRNNFDRLAKKNLCYYCSCFKIQHGKFVWFYSGISIGSHKMCLAL